MDFKKLGNILLVGGAVVLAGAFVWWFSFFSSIMNEVAKVPGGRGDIGVFDAFSCLYSNSVFCGLISGAARLAGKTAYEPMVFWFGLAALIAGILIRVTAKPSDAR